MALLNSMLSGISGLKNHQVMMDVVGNNISNVNTVGYKASRVTFADSLNQMIKSSKSSGNSSGGLNASQIGLGSKVGSIDRNWTQGTTESTNIDTNLALKGNAMFIVKSSGTTSYTRAGNFKFDEKGYLVSSENGAKVQGKVANSLGEIPSGNALTDVKVDLNQKLPAVATSKVTWAGNLSSTTEVPKTKTRAATIYGNIDSDTAVGGSVAGYSQAIYNDLGTQYSLDSNWTKTADNTWTFSWKVQKGGVDVAGSSGSITGLKFEDNSGKWTLDAASKAKFDGTANKISVPGDYLNFTIDSTLVSQTSSSSSIDVSDSVGVESENSKKTTGAVTIYDSLGNSHTLSLSFLKVGDNKWRYDASVGSTSGNLYNNYGIIDFNSDGTIKSMNPPTAQIEFDPSGGASKDQMVTLDLGSIGKFNGITQSSSESSISATEQDGSASATLLNLNVDEYGVIEGVFSNGETKSLAKVMVANFANRDGLVSTGDNMYSVSANSGAALVQDLGESSGTTVQSQRLEQSNVDLSDEFTKMIVAQRGFQANSRVITTSDSILQEITNLVR